METSVMLHAKNFMLTNYLERGSEVAVITSRLFVSLGDWPRNPSFSLNPYVVPTICPWTLPCHTRF